MYRYMHLCEHDLTAKKIGRFMCLGPVWSFLQMFSKYWELISTIKQIVTGLFYITYLFFGFNY